MEKNQILNLFSTIQQQAATLGISAEDETFCQEQQAQYDAALAYYEGLQAFISEKKPKNEYADEEYKATINVPSIIYVMKKKLINKLYYYFRNKYSVDLKDETTFRRYGLYEERYYRYDRDTENEAKLKTPLRYEDIVKDILSQTGGLSFEDVAIRQLKADFAQKARPWERHGDRVKQQGATLSIDSFVHPELSYSGVLRFSYTSEPTLFLLYKILSYVELGRVDATNWRFLHLPTNDNRSYSESELKLEMYEINGDKVKGVRFYKNGKMSIKFDSAATAAAFQRDYCREVE